MARRRRSATPRNVPRRRAPASPPKLTPPLEWGPKVALVEPPHAHIVCRVCGRISPMELLPEEAQALIALADRGPDGWTVGRIAFSLTGMCAACRDARSA